MLDRSDYIISMIGVRKYYNHIRKISDAAQLSAWETSLRIHVPLIVMDWGKRARDRANWIEPAHEHDYLTRIILLDETFDTCWMRLRADVARGARTPTTRWRLLLERYFRDFEPPTKEEADELVIIHAGDGTAI